MTTASPIPPCAPALASPWIGETGADGDRRGVFTPAGDGRFTPADAVGAGLVLVRHQRTGPDGVTEIDLDVTATVARNRIAIGQDLTCDLPWTSYVIAPGMLYDGNRFLVSSQSYCPFTPTEGVGPDGPILIVDVPRLSSATGYRVELAANALTTPFIGIFDPLSGRGVLVEVQVYGAWGTTGVTITTLPGEPVTVTAIFPVQRRRRYRFCDWVEADEPGMDLAAGQTFSTRVRMIPVVAATIPAFISELARRGFAARDRSPRAAGISLQAAAELVEAKLDAHNWNEGLAAYQTAMLSTTPRNTGWLVQTGWCGGGVVMWAMLQSPDLARRTRARRMLDLLCTASAPSGYFYGAYKDGRWLSLGAKRPGCRAFMLVRRPLELGRDILKAIALLRQRGEAIAPAWEHAAKGCLDAVVGTTRRFGHLGYSVDPETGDVLWGDSTCGAFALEFLVRGHLHFGDPAYLATAKRLAAYYRERFLLRGYTCGGVGDALMAVDSESSYALLAGLVHLHAVTRDPVHLAWAIEAADLFQTWVLLYDATFPPASLLHRLGIQPRGAVFANIQNQHGAPGICTSSGLALGQLSEASGDPRFAEVLREIVGCQPQMTVQPGQEAVWGDLPVGCVSERLMTLDGLCPNGHTEPLSTWAEVALLLAARELVGLPP